MNKLIILLIALISVGCEQTFNLPPSPAAPSINVTSTNTNTNTNNQSQDRSDADSPTPNPNPQSNQENGVIPLPSYGESVTRLVASQNQTLLANSCQEKYGETAWQFLDKVIQNLRLHSGDQRWGYLCKDASCANKARDIVAYKATSGESGLWIVDVIGNHCPLVGEIPEVRWGPLPFETVRKWSQSH